MEFGQPKLLMDYQWVHEHPEEPVPCSPDEKLLKHLRRYYKEQPIRFLDRLTQLETAFLETQAKVLEKATPEALTGKRIDEGTDRVRGLIKQILGECKT